MAKFKGEIIIDVEKCKGCQVCAPACALDCIGFSPKVNAKGYNYAVLEKSEACIGCANCAIVCPDAVITVYKEKVD
jgi:2-oxoglutarate ferredoxin oxidoreductase subunit delta